MNHVFRAPGKLFIAGEYAVLEGWPAVVMAVDRYVSVSRAETARVGGLVASARAGAALALGVEAGGLTYGADSSEFHRNGLKLGLGSSAAVTVASVASVFHEAGLDLESDSTRRSMWGVAKAVHDEFQKARGSGADLAASLFGGFVAFDPGGAGRPEIAPWVRPADVTFVYVWTGRSASTSAAIGAVQRFNEKDPAGYGRVVADMGAISRGFAGCVRGSYRAVKDAFDTYAALMEELGAASGASTVTPAIQKVRSLAHEFGGVAKPSGAGGGDFVVAAFDDVAASKRFGAAIALAGLDVFDLRTAVHGVHAAHVLSSEETGNG